ncbi:TRAP transporter small permease subunit [Halomonas piscis]|uniref:TRAP transporter small permease protein n=2 Tax=Halomonas piscis TaxID=3031727 RepID=A0ABY9Z067_9GAMM|nr:TRAP transporter small permease subunit [Halomonas piscis]WNK20426.1 TRAP transporter small permease subunit [Halomonas piscis]
MSTPTLPRWLGTLDRASQRLGHALSWLMLAMLLIEFAVVVLRYAMGINSTFMQEMVMYMHATLFMLAAGYTLRENGHVRVDIIYRRLSPRRQALINMLGIVFLLAPVMLFIIAASAGYVASSWKILEGSSNYGGIPGVFVLKTLIPVFAGLMLLQGAVEFARSAYIVAGPIGAAMPDNTRREPPDA